MGYAVDAKNGNDVREVLGRRLLSSVNKAKDVQMNPTEEG